MRKGFWVYIMPGGRKDSVYRRIILSAILSALFVCSVFVPTVAGESGITVNVHFDRAPYSTDAVRDQAIDDIKRLELENGVKVDYPIDIYVYNSLVKYREAAPQNAAGYAFPSKAQIHLRHDTDYFDVVLAHEISHVIFLRSIPGPNPIPLWFVEGLAIYQSNPSTESFEYQQKALRSDLSRFTDLDLVEDQSLASSQGYLAVDFIVSKYGKERLSAVIRNLQSGQNFRMSMETGLGESYDVVEADWNAFKVEKKELFDLAFLEYAGFILLGVLSLITPFVWKWRSARKFRELADDETSTYQEDGYEDMIFEDDP